MFLLVSKIRKTGHVLLNEKKSFGLVPFCILRELIFFSNKMTKEFPIILWVCFLLYSECDDVKTANYCSNAKSCAMIEKLSNKKLQIWYSTVSIISSLTSGDFKL